jgi:hypothetical protein
MLRCQPVAVRGFHAPVNIITEHSEDGIMILETQGLVCGL